MTRVQTIPGIGPIAASAISAEASSVCQYAHSREFAASVGLTPRQYTPGGRPRLLDQSPNTFVQAAFGRHMIGHCSLRADHTNPLIEVSQETGRLCRRYPFGQPSTCSFRIAYSSWLAQCLQRLFHKLEIAIDLLQEWRQMWIQVRRGFAPRNL
jgi:hypothetical protein